MKKSAVKFPVKKTLFIFLLFLVSTVVFAAPGEALSVKRFGLFIGANNGGAGRTMLLYADDDAQLVKDTLESVGGLEYGNGMLLVDPRIAEIDSAVDYLKGRVQRDKVSARRTEFIFYYSGHSNEEGLLLADEEIPYSVIKSKINSIEADVTVVVLDSCSSGAFTRAKGGTRQSPFLFDDSSQMEGHAYLTSSSIDEASQESDSIQGSFFTHYFISGLRGAADMTQDKRVTLNEIYQHTHNETVLRTQKTIGGTQHPNFDIQLTGTGDLVLTDLSLPSASLLISEGVEGRVYIRNEEDKLIAELKKEKVIPVTLALPDGKYQILVEDGEDTLTGNVVLRKDQAAILTSNQLRQVSSEYARIRGDSDNDTKSWDDGWGEDEWDEDDWGSDPDLEFSTRFNHNYQNIPLSLCLFPGLQYPMINGSYSADLQLGLVSNAASINYLQLSYIVGVIDDSTRGVQGAGIGNISSGAVVGGQGAGIFNITDGDLLGFQGAGVFNIAGSNMQGVQGSGVFNITGDNLLGIQGAGVFNIAGTNATGIQGAGVFNIAGQEVKGGQGAGVFNIAGENMEGVQGAGVFNVAGDNMNGVQAAGGVNVASNEFKGLQAAGVLNIANKFNGLQIGSINVSGEADGLQIGVVNIASQMNSVPIGLINLSKNGIVDVVSWYEYDSTQKWYAGFQSGGEHFYTILYVGSNDFIHSEKELPGFTTGAGLGVRFPFLLFDIDLELTAKTVPVLDYSDYTWRDFYYARNVVIPSARAICALKNFGIFWGVTADMETSWSQGVHYEGYNLDTGSNYDIYCRFIAGLHL